MAFLEVSGLFASYGDVKALTDINFVVEEGEIFGILGSNGAGKTSILRAISGLEPPRATGDLRFEGRSLRAIPAHRRSRIGIGVVPEGRRVFASLSVRDNLTLGAYGTRRRGQADQLERMLDLFPELHNRQQQPAGTLSGGEQQMLAIARALMCQPRLLLLDEPSLGLAPGVVARVFEFLRTLHTEWGLTLLIVEQNAAEALALLTRGCVIENGSLVLEGTRQDLADNERVSAAYLGDGAGK